MWTFWLVGNALVVALLGVTVARQLEHQDVGLGPNPAQSAPDLGQTTTTDLA